MYNLERALNRMGKGKVFCLCNFSAACRPSRFPLLVALFCLLFFLDLFNLILFVYFALFLSINFLFLSSFRRFSFHLSLTFFSSIRRGYEKQKSEKRDSREGGNVDTTHERNTITLHIIFWQWSLSPEITLWNKRKWYIVYIFQLQEFIFLRLNHDYWLNDVMTT